MYIYVIILQCIYNNNLFPVLTKKYWRRWRLCCEAARGRGRGRMTSSRVRLSESSFNTTSGASTSTLVNSTRSPITSDTSTGSSFTSCMSPPGGKGNKVCTLLLSLLLPLALNSNVYNVIRVREEERVLSRSFNLRSRPCWGTLCCKIYISITLKFHQ